MPDDTHMDLMERVAVLEQMLVERTAERDEALQQESATRFTHPPPRWGRAGVGVVMPRTDPW
jgi:hypothetical protein